MVDASVSDVGPEVSRAENWEAKMTMKQVRTSKTGVYRICWNPFQSLTSSKPPTGMMQVTAGKDFAKDLHVNLSQGLERLKEGPQL